MVHSEKWEMEWMDNSLQMIWQYTLQKEMRVATTALHVVTNYSDVWEAERTVLSP